MLLISEVIKRTDVGDFFYSINANRTHAMSLLEILLAESKGNNGEYY